MRLLARIFLTASLALGVAINTDVFIFAEAENNAAEIQKLLLQTKQNELRASEIKLKDLEDKDKGSGLWNFFSGIGGTLKGAAFAPVVGRLMAILSPLTEAIQIQLGNMIGPKVWLTSKSVDVNKKGPQPGDLIYNDETHESMMSYLFDLQSAYKANKGLPTLLLYSEASGTGKTEFVKRLANLPECDFEVVMLHVAQLQGPKTATGYPIYNPHKRAEFEHLLAFVNAPYRVLRFGTVKAKKTILFLDEGERLLAPKLAAGSFDERTQEIEAFLSAMGSLSQHFTVAISTNNPGQIDKAVLNRFSHHIHVKAPDDSTREKLFRHYLNEKIHSNVRYKSINLADDLFTKNGKITSVIAESEGLAGRAIEQISHASVDRAYFNTQRQVKQSIDQEDASDEELSKINHKLVLNKILAKKQEIKDQNELRDIEEKKRLNRYRENLRIVAMRQVAEAEARREIENQKKEMLGEEQREKEKNREKKILDLLKKSKIEDDDLIDDDDLN